MNDETSLFIESEEQEEDIESSDSDKENTKDDQPSEDITSVIKDLIQKGIIVIHKKNIYTMYMYIEKLLPNSELRRRARVAQ
jgi:uncharacterized membrane protein